MNASKLCDCAVCGNPVPVRAHQAPSARTCSPGCAKALAVREHPDLQQSVSRGAYWKQRLGGDA